MAQYNVIVRNHETTAIGETKKKLHNALKKQLVYLYLSGNENRIRQISSNTETRRTVFLKGRQKIST